jgi:ElaB/YqjD/DUF883 family membrane-anchored ribosome-binding protein
MVAHVLRDAFMSGQPGAFSAMRSICGVPQSQSSSARHDSIDHSACHKARRASEAKFDPRICSIWPPSGHLFHVHPGVSLVDVRPRGAPNGESNMAVRKTRDTAEHDQPAQMEVEAEIREFVRRDIVTNRERQPENESEMVASSINSLLQRTTTTSVQEIDKLITELQTLSDTLHSERARVQREIVQYSTLTRAALQSTKTIAESLTQFRKGPDVPALRDGYASAEF